MDPEHRQHGFALRLEWGPVGAQALAPVDVAVVVDVLSFTTTTVAVEGGIEVHPFGWKDERAAAFAAERDAVLAVQRQDSVGYDGAVSLSPVSVAAAVGVRRLVLPSPNGSTISTLLAGSGATVVGACLRNRGAVAAWLAPRVAAGQTVALVPAGERWPDGSLRPAVEDLWGAGAVLDALAALDVLSPAHLSPEAGAGLAAFRAAPLPDALAACSSGRELHASGFGADVEMAAQIDASSVVPVLRGGLFVAA
jgi:2-phosphosulfolactate phosphatase